MVIDQGRDPTTRKRKQKRVRFEVPRDKTQREATKLAEAALAKLLHEVDKGTFIDASKITLLEYLRSWHEKNVVPHRRPETSRVYASMIERHIAKASIANTPLQKLRTSDLEAFYTSVKLGPASANVLHAVIGRALRIAVRDTLIPANPARAVEDRPRVGKDHNKDTARAHCWTATEARLVLDAAKATGTQVSALFAVLLDTGARKSEVLGLTWSDMDLEAGTLTIHRQLEPRRRGAAPAWGPTKTKTSRTVTLGVETVTRLRLHRKAQRELRMANGQAYHNHDLVFANEPVDLQTPHLSLGDPCPSMLKREFPKVIAAAGVRLIKVHGCRHTVATLLLQAGVPVQVVAQRLGHADITETLQTYAHALPDMQRDAAAKLGVLLTGR